MTSKRAQKRAEKARKQAEFDVWLARMDEALAELFSELPEHVAAKLDYSIESLDVIEAWLLERYPKFEDTQQPDQRPLLDTVSRYIGETFVKVLGGHWTVDLKYNAYLGRPLVINPARPHLPKCPSMWTTASTDRRRGDYLSTILRNNLAILASAKET